MSVANIGKLQENTAALCRKISQNIGRKYQEALGEHRGTVQNGYETLRVSVIRGSGYVWPGTPSSPIRRQAPDVKYPDGMSMENNSGCETSRWNVGGAEFRMWDIWVECAMPHMARGLSACTRCRDPSPWWHGTCIAIRSNYIRILLGRSTWHSWSSHPGR